jgi:hypothetical protein
MSELIRRVPQTVVDSIIRNSRLDLTQVPNKDLYSEYKRRVSAEIGILDEIREGIREREKSLEDRPLLAIPSSELSEGEQVQAANLRKLLGFIEDPGKGFFPPHFFTEPPYNNFLKIWAYMIATANRREVGGRSAFGYAARGTLTFYHAAPRPSLGIAIDNRKDIFDDRTFGNEVSLHIGSPLTDKWRAEITYNRFNKTVKYDQYIGHKWIHPADPNFVHDKLDLVARQFRL